MTNQLSDNDEESSIGASRVDLSPDRHGPRRSPFVRYIELYSDMFEGSRFAAMRLAGNVCKICDGHTGLLQHTALGVWIKLLWH